MSAINQQGDTSAGSYWCHVCEKAVSIVPEPSGDVHCPDCGSEFVEEYSPSPAPAGSSANVSSSSSSSSSNTAPSSFESHIEHHANTDDPYVRNILNLFRAVDSHQQQNRARGTRRPAGSLIRIDLIPPGGSPTPGSENPFFPMFNALQQGLTGFQQVPAPLMSLFGNRVRVASASAGGNHADPQHMTFDELLNHLFTTAQVRGAPPAAKRAVDALERHTITDEEVKEHADDDFGCAVCQESFAAGDTVIKMPCDHLFHVDCLSPWLAMHNSCPSCRLELPTDDPDYEEFKKAKRTM